MAEFVSIPRNQEEAHFRALRRFAPYAIIIFVRLIPNVLHRSGYLVKPNVVEPATVPMAICVLYTHAHARAATVAVATEYALSFVGENIDDGAAVVDHGLGHLDRWLAAPR